MDESPGGCLDAHRVITVTVITGQAYDGDKQFLTCPPVMKVAASYLFNCWNSASKRGHRKAQGNYNMTRKSECECYESRKNTLR